MKKALAQLPKRTNASQEYGEDIDLDDDDLSGSGDSDHIFDDLYEDDDEDSSDFPDVDGYMGDGVVQYDRDWLTHQCIEYCIRNGGGAMGPEELSSNLLVLLASDADSALSLS